MTYPMFYLLPVISAIAAFLFYRLGLRLLQQRVYRHRAAIAQALLQELAGDFSIREKLIAPEHLEQVKPLIETHVNTFLNVKLQERLPVIAMFASPEMLGKIKEGLLEEIDLLLPEVLEKYAGQALAQFDPKAMMAQKAQALSERQVQEAVQQMAGKAGLYAAAAGFVIGCLPALLFYAFR